MADEIDPISKDQLRFQFDLDSQNDSVSKRIVRLNGNRVKLSPIRRFGPRNAVDRTPTALSGPQSFLVHSCLISLQVSVAMLQLQYIVNHNFDGEDVLERFTGAETA